MNLLDFDRYWESDLQTLQQEQYRYLHALGQRHCSKSPLYEKFVSFLDQAHPEAADLESIPFIPVSSFKEFELKSIPSEEIYKIVKSSGTSGQTPSKIYLDRITALNQTKVLSSTLSTNLGKSRLPMLILDSESMVKDRNSFSARGAGILGFSIFGKDVTYALNDDMKLNYSKIENFFERNPNSRIFLYGFTFIIWKHVLEQLGGIEHYFPEKKSYLLHGGGWKKLMGESVSKQEFNHIAAMKLGASEIVNYYGMAEQTGSIFLDCSEGYLHSTPYNSIIIRDFITLKTLPQGKEGYIQTLSLLPESYPGHSLLTEDVGRIEYIDNCPCGTRGIAFSVLRRVALAEIRGCSDTFETVS